MQVFIISLAATSTSTVIIPKSSYQHRSHQDNNMIQRGIDYIKQEIHNGKMNACRGIKLRICKNTNF